MEHQKKAAQRPPGQVTKSEPQGLRFDGLEVLTAFERGGRTFDFEYSPIESAEMVKRFADVLTKFGKTTSETVQKGANPRTELVYILSWRSKY